MKWNAYWRLMRFDKPIGVFLLWFPTAWALWFANKGMPNFNLLIFFICGTVLMRAAGCIINDIADRNFDKHITRTQFRPLTAGEVSLIDAFILLAVLLSISLYILMQLPKGCFYLGLIALLMSIVYPFCKRFFNAPQLILGLAFSMGIPMAFVASNVSLNREFFLLFLINCSWILAYDTMYAMTDKIDDLKIGIKSTAIYFAAYDRLIIAVLQVLFHGLWLLWALFYQINFLFYIVWLIASTVLIYQQKLIYKREPQECFKAFIISAYYGALMWLAIVIGL